MANGISLGRDKERIYSVLRNSAIPGGNHVTFCENDFSGLHFLYRNGNFYGKRPSNLRATKFPDEKGVFASYTKAQQILISYSEMKVNSLERCHRANKR